MQLTHERARTKLAWVLVASEKEESEAKPSEEEAMDIFYNTPLLPLVEDGTADLHCCSDHYLAEEIWSDRAR